MALLGNLKAALLLALLVSAATAAKSISGASAATIISGASAAKPISGASAAKPISGASAATIISGASTISGAPLNLKSDTIKTIDGTQYTRLNHALLADRMSKAESITASAPADGPGSINWTNIKTNCGSTLQACFSSRDCFDSALCVLGCGGPQNQDKWTCVNKCYLNYTSALLTGLSLCAQTKGCITKYSTTSAPVPSKVANQPLSTLLSLTRNDNWRIVAGINQAHDKFPNGNITFSPRQVNITFQITGNEVRKNRLIQGNLTPVSNGIYYYRSPIAQGFWYNLGFSANKNMVIIYYTEYNHLSNWYGGYILQKSVKFDQKAQDEAKKILTFAFPPGSNSVSSTPQNSRKAGEICSSPLSDICIVGYTCCISKSNIAARRYTCLPLTSNQCSEYPKGGSPIRIGIPAAPGAITLSSFGL